jgi:hypothetical protein
MSSQICNADRLSPAAVRTRRLAARLWVLRSRSSFLKKVYKNNKFSEPCWQKLRFSKIHNFSLISFNSFLKINNTQ